MQPIPLTAIRKILIIGSIGIGNLLMFSPTLRALRSRLPKAHIAILVLKETFRDLYEADENVDEVLTLTEEHYARWWKKLELIRSLRRQKYDMTLVTFPANRIEYNLLAYLTGARYRVAHRYPLKYFRSLGFLQNRSVPMDPAVHDVVQNRNLLLPLFDSVSADVHLKYPLQEEDLVRADAVIAYLPVDRESVLIGIHAGSSHERSMGFKRWQPARYVQLCQRIEKEFPAYFFIFGGPEEAQVKNYISGSLGEKAYNMESTTIGSAAGMLKRCHLLISNDSGLMHVAVALGTPVIALFGPSDPGRTAPYSPDAAIIRAGLPCSPCWSMANVGVGKIPCVYDSNICMQAISVDQVYNRVAQRIRFLQKRHT